MKRSGRCPKCQSLEVARGGGGWQDMRDGSREYTVFLCLDCGYEERYLNAPAARLGSDGFAKVRPEGDGPFR